MHPSGKLPPTLTPTGHFAGKPTLPISRSVTLIGSRKQARLQLISSSVSQSHALIVNADSGPYIRDLASREHTLVNGIEVREGALADGDEIQIGRFSFRFNASPHTQPIEAVRNIRRAAAGRLEVDGGEMPLAFEGKSMLIGRRDTCDIPLLEESVSTTHAIVFEMDGRRYIRDLASRTGTLVNGKAIHQIELSPGDEIKIGDTSMRYQTDGQPVDEMFAPPVVPADLGAVADDLIELEPTPAPTAAAAPPPQRAIRDRAPLPTAREPEPAPAPAGTEALDLVQDQPAETEDVELTPVELEAESQESEDLEPIEITPDDGFTVDDEEDRDVDDDVLIHLDAAPPAAEARHHAEEPPPEAEVELEPLPTVEAEAEAEAEVELEPIEPAHAEAPAAEQEIEIESLVTPEDEPVEVEAEAEVEVEEDIPELEPIAETTTAPAPAAPSAIDELIAPEDDLEPLVPVEEPAVARQPAKSPFSAGTGIDQNRLSEASRSAAEDLSAPESIVDEPVVSAAPPPATKKPEEKKPEEKKHVAKAPVIEALVEPVPEPAPEPVAEAIPEPEAEELVEPEPKPIEVPLAAPNQDETAPAPLKPAAKQAEAAPKPQPTQVAPARPVEKKVKEDVFRIPDEPEEEQFEDDESSEDDDASVAIADLNFDSPGAPGDLALSSHLEELADEELVEPEAEVAGTAPTDALNFDDPELAALDFSGAGEDSLPADVFAPIDEASLDLPPLDLGGEIEPMPGFGDALPADTLSLTAEAPPAEPPSFESLPQEPAKKKGRRRKKSEPIAEAPVVAEAPAPVARPTVAKAPARAEAPAPAKAAHPKTAAAPAPVEPPAVVDEPLTLIPPPAPAPQPIEVMEATQATPESALHLDEAIEAVDEIRSKPPAVSPAAEAPEEVALSDTGFGRVVEEFAGPSSGPIVEPPQPAHRAMPAAEAPPVEEVIALEPISETTDAEDSAQHVSDDSALGMLAEAVRGNEPADINAISDVALEQDEISGDEPLEVVTDEQPAERDEVEGLLPVDEAPAPEAPADERLFHLQPEPAHDVEHDIELEPLAASEPERPHDLQPVDEAPPPEELEEVELEAIEPEPGSPEPAELSEVELEELVAPDDVSPESAEGPAIAASATDDEIANWEIELEAEPASAPEQTAIPIDAAPPAAEPALAPAVEQPSAPTTPEPPAAARPSRPAPVEAFNWGANQEHFFGGQPLRLTPATRPEPAPAPAAPRRAAEQPPTASPTTPPIPTAPPPTPFAPAAAKAAPPPIAPPPQQAPAAPARPPQAPPAQRPTPRQQPSPFAGRNAAGGKPISTGFDGLVMPSAPNTDVFAHGTGGLAGLDASTGDDVFGTGRRTMPTPKPGAPTGGMPPDDGRRPTPRRASKAEPTGDAWAGAAAADAETSQRPPAALPVPEAAPRKKKRWFGLRSVMLMMAIVMPICIAAAAVSIYYFVPNKSAIIGQLRFENFSALPRQARVQLAAEEQRLLSDERMRANARAKMSAANPDPGFLEDPVSYSRVVSTQDLDLEQGVLTLTYAGGASAARQAPVFALLQALYDGNQKLVAEANELNRTVESLTRERAEASKSIEDMRVRIEELKAAAEPPDSAERAKLESEAAQLESAYNAAVATVTRLSSELKQMRENPAGAAAAAPAAPPTNDAVLGQLQGEMQQLNERVGSIQEGRSEKAKAAREKLEAALQSFNKQIEQAQGVVKNNPELLAYLTSAQRLLTSTRELTDQLIRRQQDQYGQLSELKSRLNEKMLARRAEVWKKDPQLVELMDQKEIKTRQYNAAVGQAMTTEAADLKTQLDYLESSIQARQTLVADDGFYADAIDQLQKIIEATQKGLEDDRQRTMQVLDEMQTSFARNQPALLTPEQKQLATEMEKRIADVTSARKQYTLAADTANKQADEEIRTLQTNASSLASKVQARKQQLAGTGAAAAPTPVVSIVDRERAVAQKAAELAAAELNRSEAEAAYFAANKRLLGMKSRADDARAAGERRDALMRQRDIAEQQLVQLTNQYELKDKLAKQRAYPAAPKESDIRREEKPDQRPVYTLAACGAIIAVFSCLVLLSFISNRPDPAVPVPPLYIDGHAQGSNGHPVAALEAPEEPTPVEV
jgi:pSer/pThr/pTyr-binding forkhead associated (FHA) protein